MSDFNDLKAEETASARQISEDLAIYRLEEGI
jgi:hypothetical protein